MSTRLRRRGSRAGTWLVDPSATGYGAITATAISGLTQSVLVGFPLTAAPPSTPHVPEECVVTRITGNVDFTVTAASSGTMSLGAGIYVAEWDNSTMTWSTQNPQNAIDGNRDNWLWLHNRFVNMSGFGTSNSMPIIPFCNWRGRVRIGTGQALMLVRGNGAGSSGTVLSESTLRVKISFIS